MGREERVQLTPRTGAPSAEVKNNSAMDTPLLPSQAMGLGR